MSALSSQVGGQHYKDLAIQPAQYTTANGIGHLAGDAIAYLSRYKSKGGKQDLEKAIHSIQLLVELEYPATSTGVGVVGIATREEVDDALNKSLGYGCYIHRESGDLLIQGRVPSVWRKDVKTWSHGSADSETLETYFTPIRRSDARRLVEQAGGVW